MQLVILSDLFSFKRSYLCSVWLGIEALIQVFVKLWQLPCIMWLCIVKPKAFSFSWILNWVIIFLGVLLMLVSSIGGLRAIIVSASTYKFYEWAIIWMVDRLYQSRWGLHPHKTKVVILDRMLDRFIAACTLLVNHGFVASKGLLLHFCKSIMQLDPL